MDHEDRKFLQNHNAPTPQNDSARDPLSQHDGSVSNQPSLLDDDENALSSQENSAQDLLPPEDDTDVKDASSTAGAMMLRDDYWGTLCPPIQPREEWGARPPKSFENLTTPVPLVIIHHTYKPAACFSKEACKRAMVQIQNFHMDVRGWDDIGYNFLIGDKYVFMGRGWQRVGAQAKGFNNVSIGISLIGDYTEELPQPCMLRLVKALIQCGVSNNYIAADYKLIGHRQVRDTECPGEAFYQLIQGWDHWGPMENISAPCNVTENLG